MSDKLDNSAVSKHLGQSSQYKSKYDPSLLVREPRANNRKHLNIEEGNLPFVGVDAWNGFEVSALTDNGIPTAFVAKVTYSSDSPYIVESKSMKLYWNSFNMSKLGARAYNVADKIEELAAEDLSNLLETNVEVCLFSPEAVFRQSGLSIQSISPLGDNYVNIDDAIPADDVVDTYSETPKLLLPGSTIGLGPNEKASKRFSHSALLKSNCRVTSQPDWGDVYIYMNGPNQPSDSSLLKYIISFRDECHFHEEICETIYKRLFDEFKPDELSVTCLYVRRGGWDINPTRASHEHLLHLDLSNPNHPWVKTGRQ